MVDTSSKGAVNTSRMGCIEPATIRGDTTVSTHAYPCRGGPLKRQSSSFYCPARRLTPVHRVSQLARSKLRSERIHTGAPLLSLLHIGLSCYACRPVAHLARPLHYMPSFIVLHRGSFTKCRTLHPGTCEHWCRINRPTTKTNPTHHRLPQHLPCSTLTEHSLLNISTPSSLSSNKAKPTYNISSFPLTISRVRS